MNTGRAFVLLILAVDSALQPSITDRALFGQSLVLIAVLHYDRIVSVLPW